MLISDAQRRFINKIKILNEFFKDYFHEDGEDLFSSPGRIELLGNHTDHNHGKVLVGTVDLSILAICKKSEEPYFIYKSQGFQEMKVDINDLEVKPYEYGKSIGLIRGVLFYLKQAGYKLGGVKVITSTNIFKGAGVSSSAAFEILIGKIISYLYNNDTVTHIELARFAQKAEINYFNKPCGLLDQLGISLGGVNYIDFEDVDNPRIEKLNCFFREYDIVLTYCLDSHSSLTSYYAEIKKDMSDVSKFFGKKYLRELTLGDLHENKEKIIEKLGERAYYRGEHFFEENKRVDEALQALKTHDEAKFVELIDDSGNSSFYKLKNCMVHSINENLPQGLILSKRIIKNGGTRVHGGGFAGTMIAFVSKKESESYIKTLRNKFGPRNVVKVRLSKNGTRYIGSVKEIIKIGEEND